MEPKKISGRDVKTIAAMAFIAIIYAVSEGIGFKITSGNNEISVDPRRTDSAAIDEESQDDGDED